jgi:ketosteroid isomerase-like protein
MRIFLIALLVMILSAMTSTAQIADDFAVGIKKAVAAYDKAWNAKDVKGVDRLLAADYIYLSSTGGTTDRKTTLAFIASPDYKLTFVERSELKLYHYDQNLAIVGSRWKGKGTYGKEAIDDDQRCSLVFVRVEADWKLLSEHCTQIVTK